MVGKRGTPFERFWPKVHVSETGCWIWLAAKTQGGYGSFGYPMKQTPAHRAAYRMFVGPIPEGMHLDHLCRVRACVNPAHLEPVTPKENVARAPVHPSVVRSMNMTHCKRGHEFTPENTYRSPGHPEHRACRECKRIIGRRSDEKRRGRKRKKKSDA